MDRSFLETMIGYGKLPLHLMMSIRGIANFMVLKKAVAVGDDMISQLPDDILVLIISRLPPKSLGRTSSLSKRWRHLYKLVSHIRLSCFDLLSLQDYIFQDLPDHRLHCYTTVFRRLIWIIWHRQGYKIRSLQLECCLPNRSDFQECFYHLQHSGVEALYLRFYCRKERKQTQEQQLCFPLDHLYLLPSLNLLRLSLCILQPEFGCKSCSLQTIQLKSVKVFPAALECILSACLRLHSLSICECDCPSKISISGPDLPLKSLIIQYCEGVEEIELHATNLIVLDFKNREMVNFIFDHVPQLQTLHFNVQGKNSTSRVFGASDNELPNLRSLTLVTTGSFYQESSKLMRLGVGVFMELRQLKLYVCCTPKINLVSLMIPILQSCPLLREFHLDLQNLNYEEDGPVKRGFSHSSLKQVEISGFSGKENEIGLALFILCGAVRLDEMHIMWSPKHYERCCGCIMLPRKKWDEESIRQKLQGRAISKNAHLIIQDQIST